VKDGAADGLLGASDGVEDGVLGSEDGSWKALLMPWMMAPPTAGRNDARMAWRNDVTTNQTIA
jgi:hypothetical protein